MIGKTISHYKILEKLGEGGMGVVYKAEDTKLKREVALKFLAVNALDTDDEKKRFLREAQAVAALNHSNIAHIYEIDDADGQTFIAMEYIEGKSIRNMFGGTGHVQSLPLDDAIDYTAQIAKGLQAAHEKGIIHRDIKPANIMLTKKSQVKIMDFGLAKFAGKTKLTRTDMTLGTTAYMSPEQAQGIDVDCRSDVFSLGVVLYEMLTGQSPFKGDYEQAVVYSILNEDPEPITGLRTGVPMELERIVNKCIAKHPDDRYQHVDEILVDLKSVKASPKSTSKRLLATKVQAKKIRMWGLAAIIIAMFAGAAVWEWLRPGLSTPAPVMRFRVSLPAGERITNTWMSMLALSPDGRHLVYVAMNDKGQRLYLRPMDALQAEPISGTEGASNPFFSPDGQWIGFFAGRCAKKSANRRRTAGFNHRSTGRRVRGATWSRGDVIVYTLNASAGLYQVSALGGKPKILLTPDLDNQERSLLHACFLPDDKTLLFQLLGRNGGIWTLSLQTGEKKFITSGTSPRYLPSGYLVYGSGGWLHAARFDPVRLELTEAAVPLFGGIAQTPTTGADFAVSDNGSLAYSTPKNQDRQLILIDLDGSERLISDKAGALSVPRFSPDGRRLAFRKDSNFWIYEFDQSTMSRLTFNGLAWTGEWTPDSQRLIFSANLGRVFNIYSIATDFSGVMDTLVTSEYDIVLGSLSLDGQWLVYMETHPRTGRDIWALNFGARKTPAAILQTQFKEQDPRLSANGRWLAYTSNESGRDEVYIRAFPGSGGRWLISMAGGTEPVWSPNGKELFYRQENKIIAAILEIDSAIRVVNRTVLYQRNDLAFATQFSYTNYDIHPNGNQFVMVKKVQESESELIVVLNWSEELKHLVSEGK